MLNCVKIHRHRKIYVRQREIERDIEKKRSRDMSAKKRPNISQVKVISARNGKISVAWLKRSENVKKNANALVYTLNIKRQPPHQTTPVKTHNKHGSTTTAEPNMERSSHISHTSHSHN